MTESIDEQIAAYARAAAQSDHDCANEDLAELWELLKDDDWTTGGGKK